MQTSGGEDEEFEVAVDAELAGGRLDAVLAKALPAFSRNRIKDLILAGAVAINGQTATEPKTKVKLGDALLLAAPPPEDPDPEPEDIPLDVLYEDDELIVINKPVGMVVHPAPGSPHGTLVNALLFHCKGSLPGINGVKRPGIVHRLDKDTSGVMVAAKTEVAMAHLAAQFADHGRTGPLHRAYTAFAWGTTQTGRGTVDAPLGRDAEQPAEAGRPQGWPRGDHPLRASRPVSATKAGTSPSSAASSKPAAPIKSACTWRISAIRWWPIRSMPPAMLQSPGGCPTTSVRSSTGWAGRPCMPRNWASNTPRPGKKCSSMPRCRPI